MHIFHIILPYADDIKLEDRVDMTKGRIKIEIYHFSLEDVKLFFFWQKTRLH
jgi:hypothetical protein